MNRKLCSAVLLFALAAAAGCGADDHLDSIESASLADSRERLLADYGARRGRSAVDMWQQLLPSQRAVFLTITHRLSLSNLPDGSPVLDHVRGVYSVRGQNGTSCGGPEHNRMFMTMDDALREALLGNGDPVLDDVWGGRSWGPSHDIAGPHGPFTRSDETLYGSPRGQVHFFDHAPVYPPGQDMAFVSCPSGYSLDRLIPSSEPESGTMRVFDPYTSSVEFCLFNKIHHPSTRPVCRDGLEGCVTDANLLEMDQDYTWNHDSAVLCSYGGYATGLDLYEANHGRGTFDRNWRPAGSPAPCGDGVCEGGESCGSCEADCGVCPEACGDGACNNGESCESCPGDCGGCPPAEYCGDGACNNGESCESCPGDCGSCPPSEYCGDGACNNGESCDSCPGDCGDCPPTEACGDGACNGSEWCGSCPGDCGACPEYCGDGACGGGEWCACEVDCGPCW